MADKTGIEWTDATWNPIRGCSRVSEGCRNCYAETTAKRFSGEGMPYEGLIAKGGQWNGEITLVPEKLDEPLRWQRPRRIFVNSMSDLFHENVPDDYVDKVFAVMALSERHTFQILTKRPERMRQYLLNPWTRVNIGDRAGDMVEDGDTAQTYVVNRPWPLSNVWLGVSVEDQKAADERIPLLLETPAAVRWISAEPLLGSINLEMYFEQWPDHNGVRVVQNGNGLDWVVVGGESGKDARPMYPAWAKSLRDQCKSADVPFLFKQWGEWLEGEMPAWPETADYKSTNGTGYYDGDLWMDRVGKKKAGRLLDGALHDQYPRMTRCAI